MSRIVFVDTETTGLDPSIHEVWEIALIDRRPDGDYKTHLYVRPTHLETADPNALQLNRFYERTHDFADATGDTPGPVWMGAKTAARRVARITAGAVLIGSNPGFDATFLGRFLRSQKLAPAWHYRPVCVATMAYGYLHGAAANHNVAVESGAYADTTEHVAVEDAAAHPRFASRALAEACGISPVPADLVHTAMGDAEWARDWYDAMVRGVA